MADNAAAQLDLVLGRLDSDAEAFSYNRDMKEVHLNLREAYNKIQQNLNLSSLLLTDLQELAYDVDGLIDEHPEVSITKFNKKAGRINERSVQLLNLLRGVDESSALSQATSSSSSLSQATSSSSSLSQATSSSRSVETELERSVVVNSLKQILLPDGNMVLFIHVVGVHATDNFGIAHGVYTNGDVESHFPFRFWFSIGENLDLSTVIKTITIKCKEIPSSERLLIVIEGVCDLSDVQLDNLRLLIADSGLARFCVLVTTHSDRVATTMATLPAEHLTYFSDFNSWSNFNCELPHASAIRSSQTLESGSAMDEEVASCPLFLVEVDTVATSDSLEVDPSCAHGTQVV